MLVNGHWSHINNNNSKKESARYAENWVKLTSKWCHKFVSITIFSTNFTFELGNAREIGAKIAFRKDSSGVCVRT